ncbi:MAG: preprotein translocase subunit YajC [Candidatus Binatia bacterium]
MLDVAFAQATQGSGGPPVFIQVLPWVLMFVIFYFLLIRPQQKKAREHRDMLDKLKRNDEVMTSGGIYGKVIALTDAVVTIEVAQNVRIRVSRAQISQLARVEKVSGKEVKAK